MSVRAVEVSTFKCSGDNEDTKPTPGMSKRRNMGHFGCKDTWTTRIIQRECREMPYTRLVLGERQESVVIELVM